MEILVYGALYSVQLALITLGFSLTFGVSGVANLAHGGIYVLGGYLTWLFFMNLNLPYAVAIILAILACAVLGALIYRFGLKRVRGIMLSEVIGTYGIGFIIIEALRMAGMTSYKFKLPSFVPGSFDIGTVTVDYQRLAILCVGLLLVLGLWLFTKYTKVGLAFRGIAQNERSALAYGIDSNRVAMLSVAAGAALAVVAAVVILPLGIITPDGGYDILIVAFAVGIVGGLESTMGIIVAAFLLGFAQQTAAYFLGSHWMMIVNLIAIILVLALRPSGLFGKFKELEERV